MTTTTPTITAVALVVQTVPKLLIDLPALLAGLAVQVILTIPVALVILMVPLVLTLLIALVQFFRLVVEEIPAALARLLMTELEQPTPLLNNLSNNLRHLGKQTLTDQDPRSMLLKPKGQFARLLCPLS